jgi:hypothetical protein
MTLTARDLAVFRWLGDTRVFAHRAHTPEPTPPETPPIPTPVEIPPIVDPPENVPPAPVRDPPAHPNPTPPMH